MTTYVLKGHGIFLNRYILYFIYVYFYLNFFDRKTSHFLCLYRKDNTDMKIPVHRLIKKITFFLQLFIFMVIWKLISE